MALPQSILDTLASTPAQIAALFALVPRERWDWKPLSWEGIPGEQFSALGQLCHLRDIETDGYRVRFRRALDEIDPDLESIDSYALADARDYGRDDPLDALARFRIARAETLAVLATLTDAQLDRPARFAEYGDITLRALVHILCSHDQQHLACLQWLLAKIDSDAHRSARAA